MTQDQERNRQRRTYPPRVKDPNEPEEWDGQQSKKYPPPQHRQQQED